MNEKISQIIYYLYFIIFKTPSQGIYKFIKKLLTKPKSTLRFGLTMTVLALFWPNTKAILDWLNPELNNVFFVLLTITIIVYIWKYTDPQFGQGWERDWRKWRDK